MTWSGSRWVKIPRQPPGLAAGWTKRSRSGSKQLRSTPYAAHSTRVSRTISSRSVGYDEADAAVRKAIELQPQAATNYMWLAISQILRVNRAPQWHWRKQETNPFWRTYALALAHSASGDESRGRRGPEKTDQRKRRRRRKPRSPRFMPCARTQRRCSSGWNTPGPRTTPV